MGEGSALKAMTEEDLDCLFNATTKGLEGSTFPSGIGLLISIREEQLGRAHAVIEGLCDALKKSETMRREALAELAAYHDWKWKTDHGDTPAHTAGDLPEVCPACKMLAARRDVAGAEG